MASYSLPSDKCCLIADGIQNGMCSAVANGSFNLEQDHSVTATFTIHASQEKYEPLTGKNWTTGSNVDWGLYCSELCGVISILSSVNIIVQFYTIELGKLTIKLHNKTAVE